MADRRDLHVGIDADDRGFGPAFEDAQDKARGLDRELAKLERQQAAQEKVTTRATAAVERFARAEDKAALAAHRMGLEAKRAAEQAERAEVRAAAAAEAAAKGLLDEEKAARIAARADDAVERAALKAAEAQLADAAAAEALAKAERKAAGDTDRHGASVGRTRGLLVSAVAAAAALSVPVGAAGLAFVGMAAVAAPAVAKVIKAQADLGANWETLDANQKIAASSVASLISEYKTLAKSYEPDALAEFNGIVSTARGLLPELGKTVDATKGDFLDFSNSIENTIGAQVPRLLGILRGQASPALHELGVTFNQTATLGVGLVQSLAPMGLTLLTSANGALRLLNALSSLDPRLTEFAVTALALRGPTNALAGLWEKGASKVSGLAKEGARAESFLGKLGRTVGSSPNLYIGAALAIGYVVARLATMKDSTDNLVASVRTETSAVGNNAAGHLAAASTFGRYITQAKAAAAAANADGAASENNSAAISLQQDKIKKLTEARKQELTAARNIAAGEKLLQQQYGGTARQADQLATAAGVDLSKGITGSGSAAVAARAKLAQYKAAVAAASDPTRRIAEDMQRAANSGLLMDDRMKSLDDAMAAYFGPASAAWNATTRLKQGMDELSAAMKKAHGNFSGNTAASQALRTAFDQQLNNVYALRNAEFQRTGSLEKANAAAAQQIQVLYAFARGSKQATAETDALAKSLGVTVGVTHLSHDAFIRAAGTLGVTGKAAEALWRAFQKLQTPVKLKADDAEFLSKLHAAQGLKLDPKTGLLRGNNADYFNKWLKAKGLRLDPKTGLLKGNNADYYNKWLKANGLHIDTKTGKIVGNTKAFWDAVHGIPAVVGTRRINVVAATSSDLRQGRKTFAHGGIVHRADGGPVQRMADGGPSGYVRGPGTTTSDSILTALSDKEYVVNAVATARYRPLLDAINSGRSVPVAAAPVMSGASGGSSRSVQVTQNIFQPQDPHVAARESARELAWILR